MQDKGTSPPSFARRGRLPPFTAQTFLSFPHTAILHLASRACSSIDNEIDWGITNDASHQLVSSQVFDPTAEVNPACMLRMVAKSVSGTTLLSPIPRALLYSKPKMQTFCLLLSLSLLPFPHRIHHHRVTSSFQVMQCMLHVSHHVLFISFFSSIHPSIRPPIHCRLRFTFTVAARRGQSPDGCCQISIYTTPQ